MARHSSYNSAIPPQIEDFLRIAEFWARVSISLEMERIGRMGPSIPPPEYGYESSLSDAEASGRLVEMGTEMMDAAQLRGLRFAALFFLLPGLGGMLAAAMLSTNYVESLPRLPVPVEMRYTPRNIHGTVVYETEEEDRRLTVLEYSSTGVFVLGIGLGVVYLRQWGIANAISAEDDEYAQDAP